MEGSYKLSVNSRNGILTRDARLTIIVPNKTFCLEHNEGKHQASREALASTSAFIMTFTALTGAASHFAIGGAPDLWCLVLCMAFTLLWARIAALFANRVSAKTLNRATGVVLAALGVAILSVKLIR